MLLLSVVICLYPAHSSEKLLEEAVRQQSMGLDDIYPKVWSGMVKELTKFSMFTSSPG